MSESRALAKAIGAAGRANEAVQELTKAVHDMPLEMRRQAMAVQEELDLMRHFLREAMLAIVIERSA